MELGYDSPDTLTTQSSGSATSGLSAGIAYKNSDAVPHLQRGNRATRNYVGTADGKTSAGGTEDAGIFARNQDGGGTANNYVIDGNIIRTGTQVGVDYGAGPGVSRSVRQRWTGRL